MTLHRYTYGEYLSLEDVAHDEHLIEVWRRDDAGSWTRSEARSGTIALHSIGCTLDVDDVYRDELADS